jgi:hypothetical protein
MINRLVVNGCSYMDVYVSGNGHKDLANRLMIPTAESIAQSGCNNSRILRTTLKDSYLTVHPTLYVLGMTFISRSELPILKYSAADHPSSSFEGRWTNPQNQMYSDRWEDFWTDKDTDLFVELKLKEELMSLLDRTEDLMYRMLGVVSDLTTRGHRVLMYQQADIDYFCEIDTPRLQLFKTKSNFVNNFKWSAIRWQHEKGVPINAEDYESKYGMAPEEIRHRKAGHHQMLNEYLTNYINEHKILE